MQYLAAVAGLLLGGVLIFQAVRRLIVLPGGRMLVFDHMQLAYPDKTPTELLATLRSAHTQKNQLVREAFGYLIAGGIFVSLAVYVFWFA